MVLRHLSGLFCEYIVDRLVDDDSPQKLVATPVRRSTRRSCVLPAGLRDHDVIVESVDEIGADVATRLLFRDNHALNVQWRTDEAARTKCLVETCL